MQFLFFFVKVPGVCFSSDLMHIRPTGNMYAATEPQTEVENTRLVFEKCGNNRNNGFNFALREFSFSLHVQSFWFHGSWFRLHCSWERPGFGDMDWLREQRVLDLR